MIKVDLNTLTSTLKIEPTKFDEDINHISNNDIAIIGIACKFASSNSVDEYWNLLKNGIDSIYQFPEKRQKYGNEFLQNQVKYPKGDDYFEGGFLTEVDKFDNDFFGISPIEASLMSPDQRNFLEVAWSAIEDAGYGDNQLAGTNTGIFLGHSSDFGVNYKEFIDILNPDMSSFAISGNLNSIIASRIAYLLDFKGPSINIDTACSSSLVAIHLACKSLKNGECDAALVGASKIDNLPLKSIKHKEDELGITSPDGRTRTFDFASAGTGLGEGIGAILLKPISCAIKDKDHIYAIIKGSAINEDGNSVNLTAPNPKAQEEVIIKAWQDAKVDPETITYIEAHGTGTKLGDPIEIMGITNAFRRYTNKLQFCGIGSVKSNIGHLDNAAGMAGIMKAILALENKEIPATIHFDKPNENINFESTPLYVNKIHREWETNGFPRRCGISAFGLSGTNCHIVLEEAPQEEIEKNLESYQNNILTISANSKQGVLNYIWKYQTFLYKNKNVDLNELCYTANTGRGHYKHRVAIIFKNMQDLQEKLEIATLCNLNLIDEYRGLYYGVKINKDDIISKASESEIIRETDKGRTYIANSSAQSICSCKEEDLNMLCQNYINGEDIKWEVLYDSEKCKKISLPTYPFSKISHWIESNIPMKQKTNDDKIEMIHPLVHKCLCDSFNTILYSSEFNIHDYWILNEHRIAGIAVAPGTTFIEMITLVFVRHFGRQVFEITDLVFLSPLYITNDNIIEVHTMLMIDSDKLKFTIASKNSSVNSWSTNAEGIIYFIPNEEPKKLSLDEIKKRCNDNKLKEYAYEKGQEIEISDRWSCVNNIWTNNVETLAHLGLKKEYKKEIQDYLLHPALLDEAINITLRTIGESLYLPFSYKKIKIYKKLPDQIYSYVKAKNLTALTNDLATFDVTILDENGEAILQVSDYIIKKADANLIIKKQILENIEAYQMRWIPKNKVELIPYDSDVLILISRNETINQTIVEAIKRKVSNTIEVNIGDRFSVIGNNKYQSRLQQDELKQILNNLNLYKKIHIVNMLSLSDCYDMSDNKVHMNMLNNSVYDFIELVRILMENINHHSIQITILGQYAYEVTNNQKFILPVNACCYGFGKALHYENSHLSCKCIDFDIVTEIPFIIQEILSDSKEYLVAFRDNIRYIEQLDKLEENKLKYEPVEIKENGLYLITGGTGSLGLQIARYLATKAKVKLVLLNRSQFPDENEWDLLMENTNDKFKYKISVIKEIQAMGSQVHFCSVDIARADLLEQTLNKIRDENGMINGIIHTAGVAGNGFVLKRTDEEIKNVIAPKTEGTWLLDHFTQDDNVDFFLLFSSITSIVSEAGQCDYTAGNSYLDSYASYRRKKGKKTLSINWPAWCETGMAVDYQVDFDNEIFTPMKNNEALEALNQFINLNLNNVIFGKLRYDKLINIGSKRLFHLSLDETRRYENPIGSNLRDVGSNYLHNKKMDVILTGGNNNYSITEKKIATVFGNSLGRDKVDLSDDITSLGGNSILAIKIVMDMEEAGLEVSLSDLYMYKSVRELAIHMDSLDYIVNTNELKNQKDNNHVADSKADVYLKNVEPFSDLVYKGCFFSALLPAINYFTRNQFLFFINDIIIYSVENKNDKVEFNVIYKPIYTLNECLQKVALSMRKVYKSYDIISDLKKSIEDGKPVILSIDCYFEPLSEDCYNKQHWPHNILVYGYNDLEEKLFIIEHQNSSSLLYDKRELLYNDLKKCYYGYFQNFIHLDIVNSNLYDLVYSDEIEFETYYEIEEKGKESIQTLDNMMLTYVNAILDNELIYRNNLEQLKIFRNYFLETISDETKLFELCNSIVEDISKIITGRKIDMYRFSNIFTDYKEIGNDLHEIINIWIDIRNILVRYQFSHRYTPNIKEIHKRHIDKIIELETFIHEKIINIFYEISGRFNVKKD